MGNDKSCKPPGIFIYLHIIFTYDSNKQMEKMLCLVETGFFKVSTLYKSIRNFTSYYLSTTPTHTLQLTAVTDNC